MFADELDVVEKEQQHLWDPRVPAAVTTVDDYVEEFGPLDDAVPNFLGEG